MTDTPHLGLPFIDGAQAQKHVTHNEALRILDAVIQVAVLDTNRTAPPASPADGQRHIIAVSPSGAWAGHAKAIATWEDNAWRFLVPQTGWMAWSVADDVAFVFDGSVWRDLRSLSATPDSLGIHTAADSTNRLSVRSNAVLFKNTATGDGGTGDVRLQMSKQSASNTASVVFANNFSGRAEFGLVGSDAFRLKVSPDGSAFTDALSIDQTTGNLTLPRALALTGVLSPMQMTADQDNYAPAGLSSASIVRVSGDAVRAISGFAGGGEGRTLFVVNAGTFNVILKDEGAGSTAANRLALGSDHVLAPKQGVMLIYDSGFARWRSATAAASAGSTSITVGAGLTSSANPITSSATLTLSSDVRHNLLLGAAYQSKLAGEYRRQINLFATGFKGASDALNGINTGASSNYSVAAASGYVAPSATTTALSAFSIDTDAGSVVTIFDRTVTLTNGSVIVSIDVYSTSARNFNVKIGKRNSSTNYDVVVSESFSHPGGGWMTKTLSSPCAVPGSGTYHVGASNTSYTAGQTYSLTASVGRAVLSGDATGSSVSATESTNPVFPLRFTTQPNNMTLVLGYQTADATADRAEAQVEIDNTAGGVAGTDFSVEVTCNGGTNWSAATVTSARGQAGRTVIRTADTPCTAGTSFGVRFKTLTNKSIPAYAAGVMVR